MRTKPKLTAEQRRTMALEAGSRGRSAKPMNDIVRLVNYEGLIDRHLTPAQLRRWQHKHRKMQGGQS